MQQKFDPRNEDLIVFVKDRLCKRDEAKVSVFDSSVQGGDAVWEGLRVYNGRIFCLNRHLKRLKESAAALCFAEIPDYDFIRNAIFETLKANEMKDGAHIRLTLTRGEKITSGMDPRLNTHGCCLIVLAEWKPPVYDNLSGISLFTCHIRRNSPQYLDSKIHHNNLLNNILAKIQANAAGADDALMLDSEGYVSETNATNIFMMKDGVLSTPFADSCLPGITRGIVLEIAREQGVPALERNVSLTEFYNADFVFTSGTMGELTPVKNIDGREINQSRGVALFSKINSAFRTRTESEGELLPF